MKYGLGWAVLAAAILAAGCMPKGGFLVRPVSGDEELQEAVVGGDTGWFVTAKVAVVDVDGLIMNQREGGMFGSDENPVSLFVEKIDKIKDDADVRAVVLRINSPGGGVTATDLMYRRLAALKKERGIPVVAAIQDVGASGGYYLASAADTILVAPTSVTGSIGVIVLTFNIEGTLAKIGAETKAITSGPLKDMASPFKPLGPEAEKVLQGLVTEFYDRFVDVVAAGRPALGRDAVKALADGRVYSGTQAVAKGLADSTGDLQDAIDLARKRAGLKTAKTVMYRKPWGYAGNVYSAAGIGPVQVNLGNLSAPDVMAWLRPQFLYLWTGDGGAATP